MLTTIKYFCPLPGLILSLFVVLVVAGNASGEDDIIKATSVGVVLKEQITIWSAPDGKDAEPILSAKLGDVFFLQNDPDEHSPFNNDVPEWHKALLPHGTFGWIARDDIGQQEISIISGYNRQKECAIYDSVSEKNIIAVKDSTEKLSVSNYWVVPTKEGFEEYYEIGYREHDVENDGYTWMRGWVSGADVSLSYAALYLSAGLCVDGYWQSMFWWGSSYTDLDASEKFFQLLLQKYPNEKLEDSEVIWEEYTHHPLHCDIEALVRLSAIYVDQKKYTQALQMLEQIIQEHPKEYSGTTLASGDALLKMAEIYWKHLNNPQKALSLYHQVIREYPGEEIIGFEWNSTLDIDALGGIEKIGEIFPLSPETLIEQYQNVVETSRFDVVKMMACISKTNILRKEKRFKEATRFLLLELEKTPSAPITFYVTRVDYSILAFGLLCDIYREDLKDPERAIEVCRKIYTKSQGGVLSTVALYFIASLYDYSTGSVSQVMNAYEAAITSPNFRDVDIGDENSKRLSSRLAVLTSFKATPGKINRKRVTIYQFADSKARPLTTLTQGTQVQVLYPWKHQDRLWYKVKVQDKLIGWLREDQVKLLQKPLLSGSSIPSQWQRPGANIARTRVIKEFAPIISPEMIGSFSDIPADEALFKDVNNDDIPDIIAGGFLRGIRTYSDIKTTITAIDGSTRKILWKIESEYPLECPIIDDEILYAGFMRGQLYAFDLHSGKRKWKREIGEPPIFPVVAGEKIYVGSWQQNTLLILNKKTGRTEKTLPLDGVMRIAPIIRNKILYCTIQLQDLQEKKLLLAVDLHTDEFLGTRSLGFWQKILLMAAASDNIILLVGQSDDGMYLEAIETDLHDKSNPSYKWRFHVRRYPCIPVVKDGIVYIISDNDKISAIELDSGKLKWEIKTEDRRWTLPCIVGETLYIASGNGTLSAWQTQDGKLLWEHRFAFPFCGAISSNGSVLAIPSSSNYLYVIGNEEQ